VGEVIEERGRTFVRRVIEKPCTLGNKLAIVALYAFGPCIFSALTDIKPGRGGELQLTDAIQVLIDRGSTVQAIKLQTNDVHVDIGNPDSYWEALRISHHNALSRRGRVESLPSILRSTSEHISTETRVERTQEYACEVCGALAMEGDILCNDCSRNFEVVFELVRNHPELSMRDLERMKGILELTGRTLISQRPKVETTADQAILRQRTKRIAVK
jgi:transposase-like protein